MLGRTRAERCSVRGLRLIGASTAAIVSMGILASSASANILSGNAYGESVNVTTLLGGQVLSGPLPYVTLPATGGGPFTASLASVFVPNLLSTGVLSVSTQGAINPTGYSKSSASVLNVSSPGVLSATAVASQCLTTKSGSTGSSTLTNVYVAGISVVASAAPNTVIPILGLGSVTLNEQTKKAIPGGSSIDVNAIHIRFTAQPILGGDIIIAHSHCDGAYLH